jgi:hypothetical protein
MSAFDPKRTLAGHEKFVTVFHALRFGNPSLDLDQIKSHPGQTIVNRTSELGIAVCN